MSTIPVFIPYVNRLDLLQKAIASVPRRLTTEPLVINNSDSPLTVPCHIVIPPVPLTFAQTQNFMLKIAIDRHVPFYLFMHSDAEAGPTPWKSSTRWLFTSAPRGSGGRSSRTTMRWRRSTRRR